jgi:hypothetical protein
MLRRTRSIAPRRCWVTVSNIACPRSVVDLRCRDPCGYRAGRRRPLHEPNTFMYLFIAMKRRIYEMRSRGVATAAAHDAISAAIETFMAEGSFAITLAWSPQHNDASVVFRRPAGSDACECSDRSTACRRGARSRRRRRSAQKTRRTKAHTRCNRDGVAGSDLPPKRRSPRRADPRTRRYRSGRRSHQPIHLHQLQESIKRPGQDQLSASEKPSP